MQLPLDKKDLGPFITAEAKVILKSNFEKKKTRGLP